MNNQKNRMRIVNQMITAYSVLRDRYARRGTLLTLTIFLASVILCTVTFLSDDVLAKVGLKKGGETLIVGIASSIVLFISIVELRVDWKEKSREYGLAANKLAEFKLNVRRRNGEANISPSVENEDYETSIAYQQVMKDLPRIPDKQFLKLKAYHLKKLQLSKMLDDNIGYPMILLRLRLLWASLRKSRRPYNKAKDK